MHTHTHTKAFEEWNLWFTYFVEGLIGTSPQLMCLLLIKNNVRNDIFLCNFTFMCLMLDQEGFQICEIIFSFLVFFSFSFMFMVPVIIIIISNFPYNTTFTVQGLIF